jgi:hypothetical protein
VLAERARSEGARPAAAVGITLAVRPERVIGEEPNTLRISFDSKIQYAKKKSSSLQSSQRESSGGV